MTGVAVDLVDAVDLVGALGSSPTGSTERPPRLEPSLCRFASDHYRLDDLHDDLVRLAVVVTEARSVAIDELRRPR